MQNDISIIEMVREKRRERGPDHHIDEITGQRYTTKPNYFRHKQTGECFFAIAGGLAFPARPAPGFGVIVGVVKGESDRPILKVLDEFEESDLETLLAVAEQRRHKWGFPHTLSAYCGDPERFLEAFYTFNEKLGDGKDKPAGFYLAHPEGFEDPRRTEIYLEQIYGLLRPSPNGTKRLYLGECKLLRAHLQNLPVGITAIEDHPAVAALGYAVHTLASGRLWLTFTQPEKTIPTEMNGAWGELCGEWDDRTPWDEEDDGIEGDDGLMPTVD